MNIIQKELLLLKLKLEILLIEREIKSIILETYDYYLIINIQLKNPELHDSFKEAKARYTFHNIDLKEFDDIDDKIKVSKNTIAIYKEVLDTLRKYKVVYDNLLEEYYEKYVKIHEPRKKSH